MSLTDLERILDLTEVCASIRAHKAVKRLANYLKLNKDPKYTVHNVFDLPGFCNFIICSIEQYPGGISSQSILPHKLHEDPNIAAFIQVMLEVYGFGRYVATWDESGWILSDPNRIHTEEIAKQIAKLTEAKLMAAIQTETEMDTEIFKIKYTQDKLVLRPLSGVIYARQLMTHCLEKFGMVDWRLHGHIINIVGSPIESITVSPELTCPELTCPELTRPE